MPGDSRLRPGLPWLPPTRAVMNTGQWLREGAQALALGFHKENETQVNHFTIEEEEEDRRRDYLSLDHNAAGTLHPSHTGVFHIYHMATLKI